MEKEIEDWVNREENRERAKALGIRLIQNANTPDKLKSLPSLGEFEDKAQEWATQNQMKAKLLLMKLAKKFMGGG